MVTNSLKGRQKEKRLDGKAPSLDQLHPSKGQKH